MQSNQKETRFLPAMELRSVQNEDGSRTISGYAATFNDLSRDFGGWNEKIAQGAFSRTLDSNPDVVCLRDHDNAILLGRTRSKTLTVKQDNVGLFFECSLPDTTQARDLSVLIDRGDIYGCSFSFKSVKDDWKTDSSGMATRTLIDVDLFDVSPVSNPAYLSTTLSLRSAPDEIRSMIEAHNAESRDADDADADLTEDSDDDVDSDCDCLCNPCQAGGCEGCSDLDCCLASCDCEQSSVFFRNKAQMLLDLAKHKSLSL